MSGFSNGSVAKKSEVSCQNNCGKSFILDGSFITLLAGCWQNNVSTDPNNNYTLMLCHK